MSPGLHDSKQFKVVSNHIPSNWRVFQLESGALSIGPQSWQPRGFWEACYDGDPDQLEIYKKEARIIYQEEGAL